MYTGQFHVWLCPHASLFMGFISFHMNSGLWPPVHLQQTVHWMYSMVPHLYYPTFIKISPSKHTKVQNSIANSMVIASDFSCHPRGLGTQQDSSKSHFY